MSQIYRFTLIHAIPCSCYCFFTVCYFFAFVIMNFYFYVAKYCKFPLLWSCMCVCGLQILMTFQFFFLLIFCLMMKMHIFRSFPHDIVSKVTPEIQKICFNSRRLINAKRFLFIVIEFYQSHEFQRVFPSMIILKMSKKN